MKGIKPFVFSLLLIMFSGLVNGTDIFDANEFIDLQTALNDCQNQGYFKENDLILDGISNYTALNPRLSPTKIERIFLVA